MILEDLEDVLEVPDVMRPPTSDVPLTVPVPRICGRWRLDLVAPALSTREMRSAGTGLIVPVAAFGISPALVVVFVVGNFVLPAGLLPAVNPGAGSFVFVNISVTSLRPPPGIGRLLAGAGNLLFIVVF